MNLERSAAIGGQCSGSLYVIGREPCDVGGEYRAPEQLITGGRMTVEELRGPIQIARGLTDGAARPMSGR